MQKQYELWYEFEKEMNSSNLTTHKKQVLNKFKGLNTIAFILEAIYNPYIKYYVSDKALLKLTEIDSNKVNQKVVEGFQLTTLLEALSKRVITGHEALHTSKYFIDNCGYGDIVTKILSRDSKLRVATTLINEAYPGLIETFEIQLAEKYDPKRIDFENEQWFASRKLDGVRSLCIIDYKGEIIFKSKSGKLFKTLQVLIDLLKPLGLKDVVLDGEICLVDENGNESFNGIMSEITRKDHTIKSPKFIMFDILSYTDFSRGATYHVLNERYANLVHFMTWSKLSERNFEALLHEEVKSFDDIEKWMGYSAAGKWEGVMLKKNVPYQAKRTFDMLKCKKMHDTECKIVGYEMGFLRVIVDGKEVDEEMLSAVIVEYGNSTTRVGSGFSFEERRLYYKEPEQLMGKDMTVQYFEATKDKKGNDSLRFPVKKHIYLSGKRDV